MTPSSVMAVILASGQSHRFGATNKLLADFQGKPLLSYAVKAVITAGFGTCLASVPRGEATLIDLVQKAGVEPLLNEHPERGQDYAVSLAVEQAQNRGSEGLMLVLGDMPFVTTSHLLELCSRVCHSHAAVSSAQTIMMPPVLFSRECYPFLLSLAGEGRARDFLRGLDKVVKVPLGDLAARDIDRPEDILAYSLQER